MIYILKTDTEIPDIDKRLLNNVSILNLLNVRILPFSITKKDLESIDYILLTSKNAIKAIAQHEYASLLLEKSAIVIGKRTKETWINAGGNVLFCPEKACDGITLANLASSYVKDKHILYLCGKDKANDMASLLENQCKITTINVYESYENTNMKKCMFDDESIFIFGSPKHYKTFLESYTWNPTWFAISLGDTTYASFADDIRKLNAKGDFIKALKVAQAMRNDTPMQDNADLKDS